MKHVEEQLHEEQHQRSAIVQREVLRVLHKGRHSKCCVYKFATSKS